MKIADIITRVRNIAGDTAVLQFTDSMLLDWINDGIRECAIANNLLQKRATNSTVANQADYDIPSDILKLHSVSVDNNKLRILTLQEFEEINDTTSTAVGTPTGCYVWANKITLYPIPDSAVSFVINYIYDPAVLTMVAGTPPTIPDVAPALPVGYHSRLVDYCLAQVAQQDDDSNRYQMKMNEFLTGVSNLKDEPEYANDLYPSMSISARDMGDWGPEYYG